MNAMCNLLPTDQCIIRASRPSCAGLSAACAAGPGVADSGAGAAAIVWSRVPGRLPKKNCCTSSSCRAFGPGIGPFYPPAVSIQDPAEALSERDQREGLYRNWPTAVNGGRAVGSKGGCSHGMARICHPWVASVGDRERPAEADSMDSKSRLNSFLTEPQRHRESKIFSPCLCVSVSIKPK